MVSLDPHIETPLGRSASVSSATLYNDLQKRHEQRRRPNWQSDPRAADKIRIAANGNGRQRLAAILDLANHQYAAPLALQRYEAVHRRARAEMQAYIRNPGNRFNAQWIAEVAGPDVARRHLECDGFHRGLRHRAVHLLPEAVTLASHPRYAGDDEALVAGVRNKLSELLTVDMLGPDWLEDVLPFDPTDTKWANTLGRPRSAGGLMFDTTAPRDDFELLALLLRMQAVLTGDQFEQLILRYSGGTPTYYARMSAHFGITRGAARKRHERLNRVLVFHNLKIAHVDEYSGSLLASNWPDPNNVRPVKDWKRYLSDPYWKPSASGPV